ncbi:MAG: large conductance mechanosensitive channel protein MscL [Clostridia bacterium]|nr:large conductance mechanosensitive channel protein MscL [Clostridia bacterium]
MKKLWAEFKKFISRGNIMDLAVGVIVGGAFTAIVTALTNNILRPIVNVLIALIVGGDGLESAVTFLSKAYTTDAEGNAVVDLANSIYIDWGAFITAIIDFIIIAVVIFTIVKLFNKSKELAKESAEKISKATLSKAEKKELKAAGINHKDKLAVAAYFDAKKAEEDKKKAEEAEKARFAEEEAKKNSTEYLLKEIRDLLAENQKLKAEAETKPKATRKKKVETKEAVE